MRILRKAAGVMALWLLFLPCCAARLEKPTGNVTVLLFRTEAVQRLQVRTHSASVVRCAACKEEHGEIDLDLHWQGGFMLDGSNRAVTAIAVNGGAELLTGGGQRAETAGKWIIDSEKDRLRVRVTISRERYVEAVLAAEAGPAAPMEVLKALAVTTRSFAAATPPRHEGAAMCDTTHCQALRLRLGAVPQTIREAVWATSGETLWFQGRQVPAYFSEHCGGHTEDAALAWGGPMLPWLPAHSDPWCARVPSQWKATLAETEVRHALAAEGFVLTSPILEISAAERDKSGRLQQVRVRCSDGTKTLSAATLRFALNRSLGWNQLRSDRYQVRRIGKDILFEGSGFGHGVGMCQAGAAEMARSGKNYRDILATYFPGASARIEAQDRGWVNSFGVGFSLRTTSQKTVLMREANEAFAKARERWGAAVAVSPSVTIFPSTEAFRQATGQPGWELAVTQGVRIAMQPASVLRAHGGAEPVFRHEFLHSFIEAESSPRAPLWLREGLAAELNGERCSRTQTDSPQQVDAALRAHSSLSEAGNAHAEACALTRQFVAEHGIAAAHRLLKQP